MRKLFPEISPNQSFFLPTDPPHELYVEECGNAHGIPLLFLHGGPGAGCTATHRRFFDPEIYRAILFDQRGAGRSRPHASLEANTTMHLVQDIERIRERLGIDRWVLFGGSWGSTLALVYAEAHPDRVLAMILRSVFLCRHREIQWFYQDGANRIYPDYWQDFVAPIPESERDRLVAAYYRRLTGEDEIGRMAAAKAWAKWEGRCSTITSNSKMERYFGDPHLALALARIEAHYVLNNGFLSINQILRDAHRLARIPGVIVHGRYDVVCPVDAAVALNRAWPKSELVIVPEAGHAVTEPGITDALLKATQQVARFLSHGHAG